MKESHVHELLLQALETEQGGIQVYATAIECAVHPELKNEWTKYLGQTQRHEVILREVLGVFDIDPEEVTPGRLVVRHLAEAFVQAMTMARAGGDKAAAQLVAAECVVLAETKDHLNWELLGEVAEHMKGERGTALRKAQDEVEDQEDEHVYHTTGWTRELWIDALGMPAVLPPPEEEKDVKTAIGAARAKNARAEML